MGSHSLFKIGADVELWRVVGHLCLLLTFLVLLEQLLHKAEHALRHSPKYFEMLRKIYRELMILGLLSLGIKAIKELALADADSKNMLAFQAADIVVFLSALALILQAICIFAVLHRRNKREDRYELVSTRDLAELVSHHEAVARTKTWLQRHWPWARAAAASTLQTVGGAGRTLSSSHYHDMTRLRVLRHFFLRSQGLPEFFPFAKYLRHAQDNQISHMIEVEVSVWVLLMGISWLLDFLSATIEPRVDQSIDGLSVVVMFVVFAWAVTLAHALFAYYLHDLLRGVLAACGYTSARHRLKCLRTIADDEERQLADDLLDNAVETMQRVQDERELEQVQKDTKYTGLARHDTGLQLLVLLARRLCGKKASAKAVKTAHRDHRVSTVDEDDDLQHLEHGYVTSVTHAEAKKSDRKAATHSPRHLFSRKVIHFIVKLLLVLNGFFFALMCQAALYDLPAIYHQFGAIPMLVVPLPLLLNIFFLQPRIFRDYVLVACLFRVDVVTLSEVITQFSESVELRAEFVGHLTTRMKDNGQTLADLRRHFRASDPNGTGLIELEELRQILRHFACQVSYFRFNDVAKLLFRLNGTCVEYAQVERLLELAEMEDHARESEAGIASSHRGPHYMRTVMAEEAELHRRERCSTMEPTQAWGFPSSAQTPQHDHFSGSFINRMGEAPIVPILLTPMTPPLPSPPPMMAVASPAIYLESEDPHYFAHL